MSTKPTSLSPEQREFLEKNFAKVVEALQKVMITGTTSDVRCWSFTGILTSEFGGLGKDFYEDIYFFLYDKVKDKTKKLQRDEKKAFDRQVKLLDEIRVLAKEQNNLKVCLESIKEQNKLVGLYNFNFFDSSLGSKNLDNIQSKVYKELEIELFDEDLDED